MSASTAILGIRVDGVTMGEAIQKIEGWIAEGKGARVVTVGTEMAMAARKSRDLADLLNGATLLVPDTSGIVWASSVLGNPVPEKVAGIDLLERLAEVSAKKGYGIFLLGGKPGIAEKAAENLQERFPPLKVAGTHHGYFQENDNEAIISAIKATSPHILLAALGFPRQERWLEKNVRDLGVVGIGVGGSFDVLAGTLRRAPHWMRRCHLEWLWRLFQEPSRWKRMLVLPHFAMIILKERFTGNRQGS